MNSKEALDNIQYMLKQTNNLVFYKDEIKAIQKGLETLDIFKKYLKIQTHDKPLFNGTYMINVEDDYGYLLMFVTEEEKNLLKVWLGNE